MWRMLAVVVAAVVVLILLAGCGGGEEQGPIHKTPTATVEPGPSATKAATVEPSPAATATVEAALSSGTKAVGRAMVEALRIQAGTLTAPEGYGEYPAPEEYTAFKIMEEACSAIEQVRREGSGSGGGWWGRIDAHPSMSPFCVRWGIVKNMRPPLAADGTYDRSEIYEKMAELAEDIEEFIGE